jgi:uncharacterized protein (DUF486 family)
MTSSQTNTPSDASSPRASLPENRLKSIRLAAAVIWTIAIFTVCWLPRDYVQKVEYDSPWLKIPNLDKIVHCAIFVVFAILWRRFAPERRTVWAVVLGGLAAAALTEIGQLMPVVNRDAELYDFVLDGVGILIGIAVAGLVEPLLAIPERWVFRPRAGGVPGTDTTPAK